MRDYFAKPKRLIMQAAAFALLPVLFVACSEQRFTVPTESLTQAHAGFYSIESLFAAPGPDGSLLPDELDLKVADNMLFVRLFVQPAAGEQCFINGAATRQEQVFIHEDTVNACWLRIAVADNSIVLETAEEANCASTCRQGTGFANASFPLASRWISAEPTEEVSCY